MVIILTLTQTNKVNIMKSNPIAKEGLQLSFLVLIPLDFNQSSKRRNNENESLKWVYQRVIFLVETITKSYVQHHSIGAFYCRIRVSFLQTPSNLWICLRWLSMSCGRSIVRLEIYFTTYFWSSARHCFCISLQIKPYLVQARRHAFSTTHGLKTAGFCLSQNHE